MSKYLWFQLTDREVWHMVRDVDQHKTLCGLEMSVGRVYSIRDELGDKNPCDNCTEVAARREDAGTQPEV